MNLPARPRSPHLHPSTRTARATTHAPTPSGGQSPCTKLQHGQALTLALLILAGFALLFAAYTWLVLHWSYSNGERAGYVQKLSRKGWVCKTWEGDLAMVNLPGQPAEIFHFSVRDTATAHRINALVGRRVSLIYEEHVGIPTTCFGETGHFIVDVRPVTESGLPN